ncbi:hypothetical protein D3C78_706570 [compost metagenome]
MADRNSANLPCTTRITAGRLCIFACQDPALVQWGIERQPPRRPAPDSARQGTVDVPLASVERACHRAWLLTTESAVQCARSAQLRCLDRALRHLCRPGNWHSGVPFQVLLTMRQKRVAPPTAGSFQSITTINTAAVKTASIFCPCKKCGSARAPDRYKSK